MKGKIIYTYIQQYGMFVFVLLILDLSYIINFSCVKKFSLYIFQIILVHG